MFLVECIMNIIIQPVPFVACPCAALCQPRVIRKRVITTISISLSILTRFARRNGSIKMMLFNSIFQRFIVDLLSGINLTTCIATNYQFMLGNNSAIRRAVTMAF